MLPISTYSSKHFAQLNKCFCTLVDYQRIYHKMEASTHSFVGLEPLKQQFLRFAQTAILNQKRKQLSFQVEDMSTQCLHFIFQGNPGTRKTTFTHKVAGINRQVLLTATTLSRTCEYKFKYNEQKFILGHLQKCGILQKICFPADNSLKCFKKCCIIWDAFGSLSLQSNQTKVFFSLSNWISTVSSSVRFC